MKRKIAIEYKASEISYRAIADALYKTLKEEKGKEKKKAV